MQKTVLHLPVVTHDHSPSPSHISFILRVPFGTGVAVHGSNVVLFELPRTTSLPPPPFSLPSPSLQVVASGYIDTERPAMEAEHHLLLVFVEMKGGR